MKKIILITGILVAGMLVGCAKYGGKGDSVTAEVETSSKYDDVVDDAVPYMVVYNDEVYICREIGSYTDYEYEKMLEDGELVIENEAGTVNYIYNAVPTKNLECNFITNGTMYAAKYNDKNVFCFVMPDASAIFEYTEYADITDSENVT